MTDGAFPPHARSATSSSAQLPNQSAPTNISSISPNDSASSYMEHYRLAGGPPSTIPSGQSSTMMMHNPKRPYRQRRKDPSCDACRERKVKCDATETTSCTECSSRNVRCQFTKDTNRRMSSIKQVQDLERQLLDTKQQLERYRAVEHHGQASPALSRSPSESLAEVPTLGKSPRRMLKAKTLQDLSHARSQLTNYGRGLLKPPVVVSFETSCEEITISEQPLPIRQEADILVRTYLECIHRHFPVIYWPDFRHFYITLYEGKETEHNTTTNKDLLGLLFAAFACATLHVDEPGLQQKNHEFLERAMSTVKMWQEDLSTTQAITCFLVSHYLFETNHRSASWIWVTCAIRTVQDKGLHVQGGQWSTAEGEMRKRIWYSFYVWDRIISLELGKPMLIDDDECDTEYPDSLDEEVDGSEDGLGLFQPTLLLAAVHIARLMSPLSRLFRSLCITTQTLHKFEAHLYSCLYLLPRPIQLSSSAVLNPFYLRPIVYFQNARLLLHRHNVSPACSGEQRSQAIAQCVYIAQDTATTLARTMSGVDSSDWQKRVCHSSNLLLCTHIWRCMLFLVFRQLYEAFFVLHRVASAIGDKRSVNVCCGRYLLFFSKCLVERIEQGKLTELEQDEELLAYLSGDLQAGTTGWVWGNAETGTLLSRRQKHGKTRNPSRDREHGSPPTTDTASTWTTALTEEEQQHWGGWQCVEQAVQHLKRTTERLSQQGLSQIPVTLPPPSQATGTFDTFTARPSSHSTSDPSRSRMNIASII